MFIETSPILIAITFTVSILHSLFDFLAFKNGILDNDQKIFNFGKIAKI